MKKYLLILMLLAIGATAQSQVLISILLGDKLNSPNLEFGLEGGVNWTQITGMETTNFSRMWNLGFYFDIRLKNQWWLYTGVLVKANMGVDKLTAGDLDFLETQIYTDNSSGENEQVAGDYSQKLNYFLVPAMIKYKFKNNFYAEAGFQAGLMHKAWVEFNSDIDSIDVTGKDDNKDKINRIDVGAMAGFGYHFKNSGGMSIGVKYYEGFANVYKGTPGNRNRSIFLKVTVPIGAHGKDDIKKKEGKSKNKKEGKSKKTKDKQ